MYLGLFKLNYMTIDLNCDLGEYDVSGNIGTDEAIMPFITSANIACGLHAGSPLIMERTARMAIKHGVAIGAHPAYPDREGFGRRSLTLTDEELRATILYQIGALKTIAESSGSRLQHVKPHGFLYNQASVDPKMAMVIAKSVMETDQSLILVGLSGSQLIWAAGEIGLPFACEVFADRAYDDEGNLVSRNIPGSVLYDTEIVIDRVLRMINEKVVESVSGKIIPVRPDTICLHGDNEMAALFARRLSEALQENGIVLKSMGKK
jgi:UPF0271 protein